MDEWMDRWMDEWMDGWMNEWMNESQGGIATCKGNLATDNCRSLCGLSTSLGRWCHPFFHLEVHRELQEPTLSLWTSSLGRPCCPLSRREVRRADFGTFSRPSILQVRFFHFSALDNFSENYNHSKQMALLRENRWRCLLWAKYNIKNVIWP